MEERTRMVHIRMPVELIGEMDNFLKKHKGSKTSFIVSAVVERLRQEKARQSFKKLRGSLKPEDAPEWMSEDKASRWVERMRVAERNTPEWPTS
ncbi:MAG: hypothetical protein KGZ75_12085 [Syntrophomonadaceae bacterium]|nr:hypothetical protein [Syntrophomonadaceae bacterium]